MVAPAIAAAIGLGERQGRSSEDTVLGWLAPRETLLVLDNCEHLLDGLPVLLEQVLAASPRLSVLVTSRAAAGAVRVDIPGAPSQDPLVRRGWFCRVTYSSARNCSERCS